VRSHWCENDFFALMQIKLISTRKELGNDLHVLLPIPCSLAVCSYLFLSLSLSFFFFFFFFRALFLHTYPHTERIRYE